jgi:hypothetical protein
MTLFPLGLLSQGGGAAAAGAFELISTQVLGSNTSSVTFSSIPSTYKHLQLRVVGRATSTGNATALFVRCNGVSGTSYSTHNLYAAGGGSGAVYAEGYTGLDAFYRMPIPDDALTANAFGTVFIDFLDYSVTTKNKTLRALTGYAASGVYNTNLVSGAFNSTSAISSISLTPGAGQLKTGSRFSLYGIQGV